MGANFLQVQEELLAQHAMEESVGENSEDEIFQRRRREAVVVPSTQYYPASSYSHYVPSYTGPPYYPSPVVTGAVSPPLLRSPLLPTFPFNTGFRIIPQAQSQVPSMIQEGEEEPAALSL